jgi:hypothetical protein
MVPHPVRTEEDRLGRGAVDVDLDGNIGAARAIRPGVDGA